MRPVDREADRDLEVACQAASRRRRARLPQNRCARGSRAGQRPGSSPTRWPSRHSLGSCKRERFEDPDLVIGVVGSGIARAQHPCQGFAGLVEEAQRGRESESPLVGRRGVLLLAGTTSSNVASRSKVTDDGAPPANHASSRACPCARSTASGTQPEDSSRNAVESEATCANRSGWLRSTARSLNASPPSANITARCVSTTPGSRRLRRFTTGPIPAENAAVSPNRSASSARRRVPAWLATPLPSGVTATRTAARVLFTLDMPFWLVRLVFQQLQSHLPGGRFRGCAAVSSRAFLQDQG